MAAARKVIELSIAETDPADLLALAHGAGEPGGAGADPAALPGRSVELRSRDHGWGDAADRPALPGAGGRVWRRLTIVLGPARSLRSRWKHGRGWRRWPAKRPRTWDTRMNSGRRDCRLAMPESMRRVRGRLPGADRAVRSFTGTTQPSPLPHIFPGRSVSSTSCRGPWSRE